MEQSFEKKLLKKRLIIFVVLVMALGWGFFLSIPLMGITYGEGLSIALLTGAMLTPTLSNLLTRLITKEGFKNMYLRPNFKGNIKKYLVVYFGPTMLLFLSGAFYFLIFPQQFDSQLTTLQSVTQQTTTLTPSSLLLISVLQVIIIGPVINIIPTLGEELGWRGYLQPKLCQVVSDRAALVITGVIWGVWHLPVIIMGHNYGTDYIGYPWLGILAMILFCVSLGVIEGYATIKLKSAVPAAMIHSMVNASAALPIYLAKGDYNLILGPAIFGVVGGLPFLLVAIWLLIKVGKKPAINS